MIVTKHHTKDLEPGRHTLDRAHAVLAWHFLPADGMTRFDHNGRGRILVTPGKQLVHRGIVQLCKGGLHASVLPLDALGYARDFNGTTVCRVACWGDVHVGLSKLAASNRALLWKADACKAMRLWACDVAETCVHKLVEHPDKRIVAAIATSRLYANGNATTRELRLARYSAWQAHCELYGSGHGNSPYTAAFYAASAHSDTAYYTAYSAAAGEYTNGYVVRETDIRKLNTSFHSALMALAPAGYHE